MKFKKEFIRTLPKVLLHDHLDGGVRPQTVIELAKDQKYKKLPTSDAGELAEWFHRGATRGSLSLFLEGFDHTCGVMQTEEALERVAYETLEDMKKDGVVYIAGKTNFEWNTLVEYILSKCSHTHHFTFLHTHIFDKPRCMSDAMCTAPLNCLPNGFFSKRLTCMDGNVKIFPLDVLECIHMFLWRITAFFAGKIEPNHSAIPEINRQLRHL